MLNVDSSVFTVFRPAPNKHGEPAWSMQVHEAQDVCVISDSLCVLFMDKVACEKCAHISVNVVIL